LPIAPRISDRGEADLDADRCAVLPEQPVGELATVVGDDVVRYTSPQMNLTANLAEIVCTSSTSTHLVNLLIVT
jgi:hypothetical protein